MAVRPKSICRHAGCGKAIAAPGYCDKHAKDAVGWYRSHGNLTAAERGYGAAWKALRERIMHRDCGLCQSCMKLGIIKGAAEVDHIIPKSQGGTDAEENLQALCTPCHQKKTQRESRA